MEKAEDRPVQEKLSGAMEKFGNILSNRSFPSRSLEEIVSSSVSSKKGYLLPEFSTDSLGEILNSQPLHGFGVLGKYEGDHRPRSRLQSLLEKYCDSDPRSTQERDEDGFLVPPPLSPLNCNPRKFDSSKTSEPFRRCRPWNYSDFVQRLQTFHQPLNWLGKPDVLSPLQCALHGWCNTDMNLITCLLCRESFKHLSGDILADLKLSSTLLVDSHAVSCDWRRSWCRAYFANVPHFDSFNMIVEDVMESAIDILLAFSRTNFGLIVKDVKELEFTSTTQNEPLPTHTTLPESERISDEVLQAVAADLYPNVSSSEIAARHDQGDVDEESEELQRQIIGSILDRLVNTAAAKLVPSLHCDLSSLSVDDAPRLLQAFHFHANGSPMLDTVIPIPDCTGDIVVGKYLGSALSTISSHRRSQLAYHKNIFLCETKELLSSFLQKYPLTTGNEMDLIRLSFLLSITGWRWTASGDQEGSSSKTSLHLSCPLCCQKLSLWTFVTYSSDKKLNLSKQHRYYCPYVNEQVFYEDLSGEGSTAAAPSSVPSSTLPNQRSRVFGWEHCIRVLDEFLEELPENRTNNSWNRCASLLTHSGRKRTFSGSSVSPRKGQELEESSASTPQQVSPEHVYKRIRSVLHQAIF